MTTVRNLQSPPSMTLRTGGSWHTSNHVRAEIWQTPPKNPWKPLVDIWVEFNTIKSPGGKILN